MNIDSLRRAFNFYVDQNYIPAKVFLSWPGL